MDRNEIITMKSQFDAIAHYDDEAQIEFWYARELHAVSNHFADVGKMISIGACLGIIPDVLQISGKKNKPSQKRESPFELASHTLFPRN